MSEARAVRFPVTGTITFDNLMEIRRAGEAAIGQADDGVIFDMTGLEQGNSAAVAVLMSWFRAADRHGKTVSFVGLPAELESIIELSGLTGVLPVERAPEPAAQDT